MPLMAARTGMQFPITGVQVHLHPPALPLPGVPGLQSLRICRDRFSGACLGYGFIDFESTEACSAFAEGPLAQQLQLKEGQAPLMLEYSCAAMVPSEDVALDWVCSRCRADNFAK